MHRILALMDLSAKIEQHLAFIVEFLKSLKPEAKSVEAATQWLDNQDVMQMLKISESTLRRRRIEGSIPSTRIKGKYYYKVEDIQALLEKDLK